MWNWLIIPVGKLKFSEPRSEKFSKQVYWLPKKIVSYLLYLPLQILQLPIIRLKRLLLNLVFDYYFCYGFCEKVADLNISTDNLIIYTSYTKLSNLIYKQNFLLTRQVIIQETVAITLFLVINKLLLLV